MDFRLAVKKDLPYLETMFLEIVKSMDEKNIHIWNEYYPFEEFENDIENNALYLGIIDEKIVSAICLVEEYDGSQFCKWGKDNVNALYICRFGVNVNFQRQGIAKQTLEFCKEFAKQNNVEYLRLLVADINQPATNFYLKNGFNKVNGFRDEFSPTLNKTLREYGYELKI